ncbi:MAG: hypothetical protein OXH31_04645, partial [Gammaproteobacteria bacterium]|nr:hypothetical protein [Gammaproteobacteria bacterium]
MKISEKLKQWTLGAVLSVVVALPVSLFGDELSRVVGEAVKIGEWHALRAFDFYENFGNEGVKIDSENLTMMFLHRDPESRMHSYKSFRLDVVEPAVEELVTIDQKNYQQDAVEFHLVPEQRNELTNNLDSHITHENSRPKLNLDKAMEKFQDIVVPTKYKTDVKGGAHLSFSNVRITLYKKEDGTSEATQFEYFYITENPDGSLVFKIETLTPEEPIFIDRTKIWEEVIPSIPEIEDE